MKLTSRPHHALFTLRRLERLALPFLFSGLLAPSLGSFPSPVHAEDSFDDTDYIKMLDERDKGVGWNVSPGISGGLTTPLEGYKNYQKSGNGAVDVYFRPPVPQFPEWPSRTMFRLSGEYFPLEVPKEVKGVVEDLYALTGTVIYRFMRMDGTPENDRFVPYLGAGVGVFWDRFKLDYPGVGKTSSVDTFFGYTGSGGILLPCLGPIRIVPEVRCYSFMRANGNWASHMTYQLGFVYWLPAKQEE